MPVLTDGIPSHIGFLPHPTTLLRFLGSSRPSLSARETSQGRRAPPPGSAERVERPEVGGACGEVMEALAIEGPERTSITKGPLS